MFTITIAADLEDSYEMNHSEAMEFLDNLGIIGIEALRDAEDFKYATYFDDNLIPVFIEYHADSRI